MAERNPYFNFGAGDICIYQRSNGVPLAHLRAIGDCTGDFTADTARVEGGSQNWAWRIAVIGFKGSLKLKVKEVNPEALAIYMGGALTNYTAQPVNGNVIDLANVQGTTLNSATGFISIAYSTGNQANMKPGYYCAVASDATHINIYGYSSSYLNRGTVVSPGDLILLTATPLVIPSGMGATLDIPTLGITMTRGASAISVTSGDSMRFFVEPPFNYGWRMKFGQSVPSFTDVGVVVNGERDTGEEYIAHFYKCKCTGGSIPFTRKGFAETDLAIEPMYDSVIDGVGEITVHRE